MVDITTGLPFANVAMFMPTNYPPVKKAKVGKSDGSGGFKTMKLKVGLWIFKFSVPGYVDQFITCQINSKEIFKITVEMKPG